MDDAARAALSAFLPPSFAVDELTPRQLVEERTGWVLKRAYGRVGDQVYVGCLESPESWSEIVGAVLALTSEGESWVAQRFVHQRAISTPWGNRFVTLGAYLLDGRFSGYFARITPASHVSHDALCVPVFVERGAA